MDDKQLIKATSITFLLSFIYAVIRYNIFKGVLWIHLPLYIFNKAISLTSILLLAASFLSRIFSVFSKSRKKVSTAPLVWVALVLAFLHSFISGVLLRPATYPQFFSDEQLNLRGETSLLLGILAFVAMLSMGVYSIYKRINTAVPIKHPFLQFLKYGTLYLIGGHTLILGLNTWLKPQDWPGYMLPISLIAFSVIVFTVIYRITKRNAPTLNISTTTNLSTKSRNSCIKKQLQKPETESIEN
jgi:hypothetical protein